MADKKNKTLGVENESVELDTSTVIKNKTATSEAVTNDTEVTENQNQVTDESESRAKSISNLPLQKETIEKWKKTLLFLTPILAGLIINVIAGMVNILFLLVVATVVRQAFNEEQDMVVSVQNTFTVFSGLASAACAPLMIRYGFRRVAIGGSVLLIFSCISSSLTTTADILAIPYGFMGGIAYGLLHTTGIVSVFDYLHKKPVLAIFLSTLCFFIGNITGIFVNLFEMQSYISSSRRWPNALRIFEVPAVIGLLAGSFLQKNSNTQQKVPEVFKHPPFYFILAIRVVVSIGLTIVFPTIQILPRERNFPAYLYHPLVTPFILMFLTQFLFTIILLIIRRFRAKQIKATALVVFGSIVLTFGLITMFHQVAFVHAWPLTLFGVFLGIVQVCSQSLVPLAVVHSTGKRNYKLVLPLLTGLQELGGLIGRGSQERIQKATSTVNGALYYAGVNLVLGGVGAIVAWVASKRWPLLDDEPLAKPFKRGADNSEENLDATVEETEEQEET